MYRRDWIAINQTVRDVAEDTSKWFNVGKEIWSKDRGFQGNMKTEESARLMVKVHNSYILLYNEVMRALKRAHDLTLQLEKKNDGIK